MPVTPCSEPHDSEVYLAHQIEGAEFPGQEGISALVEETCLPGFESFVGMPYDDSSLEVTWLEPTVQSWGQGDRELLCLVVDPAGAVTGSLRGAKR